MDLKIVFALIRAILAHILLHIQGITLPIFIRHKQYRRLICYRIFFLIGVCDIFQLCAEMMALYGAVLGQTLSPQIVQKIVGALYGASWDMLYIFQLILALNRLTFVVKTICSSAGEQPLSERIIFNIIFAGACACATTILALFCSPFAGYEFSSDLLIWTYDPSVQHLAEFQTFRNVETILYTIIPPICFTLYIFIIVALIMMKICSNISLPSNEMRIMTVSGLIFAMFAIGVVLVHLTQPPFTVEQVAAIDFWNLLTCGINPFFYILIEPEYRQHCRAMCSKMAQQFRRCFCCCFKRTSSAVNTYNGLNGGIAAVPNTALKISRIPISAESQKANSNGRMIQISKAKETTVTSQCWAITRK